MATSDRRLATLRCALGALILLWAIRRMFGGRK